MSVAKLCRSSSLLSCYDGLFGFELPLDDDKYPGTIFRFPLRTPHAKSKLSETTYSRDKIYQNLFCSLKEEATMLLLFLKSITSISLYNYDQLSGKPKLLLDISIDTKRIPQVQMERKRCIELAREWQARQNTVIRLYSLAINITDAFSGEPFTNESFHLVLNSIGTSYEEINAKAEQLKVIPWVGIAAPCSFSSVVENCEMSVCGNEVNMEGRLASLSRIEWHYIDPVVSGHTFCFLPLPNPTGLPVSINGYFSIADNRRSIKWPTHDEHGKGADFNKELVMKMVSYAYAVMITCRCQLVSYVNTPSYLSTKLSDAYSIWPLMSQVRNHPIWSCLVEPVVRLLIGQKVVWTAAEGGKWVKFSDAYYKPEDSNIPDAVVDVLLEIGVSFVALPKAVLESIRTVHDLAAVIKSREITPDLLQRSLRQFNFIPSTLLHQLKCIEILTYVLSDFSNYLNPNSLLGINMIPLMDEAASPKQLSSSFNAEMLYILENNACASFLPGISNRIIANNLPSEIIAKLKRLSRTTNMNVKLADDGVVCKELLSLSLQQWQIRLPEKFTWYPGQGNHPPMKWIFYLWKWLADVDLSLIQNYALVSQEKLSSSTDVVKAVNLLSLSKCRRTSLSLGAGASGVNNKVTDLLKALGIIIIAKCGGVFQNSGLYDHILDITPKNVIALLTNNKRDFGIGSIKWWTANDKQIFFQYLSAAGDTSMLSSTEVKLVKDLPIFRVGISEQQYATLHNRNCFIVQQPFGLRIDAINVAYPDNVFYCTAKETNFMCALGCVELTYYDYCLNYFLPFCAKQNAAQKVKNYQWILSCEFLWCSNLTRYLQNTPLVTTANTHRIVKASDLYDPVEPAISQLFSSSEDELPSHEYQRFLSQLRRLGLITWNMITSNSEKYEQLLINRTQSVSTVLQRNGMEIAMKRSLVAVMYLVDYFTKYNPSYAFENRIKSVKFLFCASAPTPAYPTGLQWGGLNRSNNVFSPNELYCSENSLLVGGTSKILSRKYLNFTSCKQFQDLFKVPDMLTVIDQLNLLIASKPTSTFPTSVYAIYDYFNNNLSQFKMHCCRLNSKWIWVGNQRCFEDFSKFAMHPFVGKHLEPFCYTIVQAPELLKYEQIFSAYGIPDVFPEDTMLNVISQLQKHTSQLNSGHLDVVFTILDWVHETNRETGEVANNILMPTDDCRLLPARQCIFDDRGWSRDRHRNKKSVSGFSFTHRRLPLDTAIFFGVKLLSQHLLPSVNLKLEYNLTGPHQSITGRIKEALEDYDQDIDVFKEMIQNAEDAGASEIKFVIDWRNHPTEYLLTAEMKAWQGPALLVHNNAVFSDKDFTNICEIAGASKKIDPTKIGRFGVGFCSVYHITDVPSFISRNFYTVFDPNLLYLKERVTSTNPGIRINFKSSTTESLKEFKDQFVPFCCDMFQCDVFGNTKYYNGTLFRFPFRTNQTAEQSRISQEVYLKERIDKLIETFCEKATTMMIFLHKLSSISLHELQQQGSIKCLLQVNKEQIRSEPVAPSLVKIFKDNLQTDSASTILLNCQVRESIIKSNKSEDHWKVISCLGDSESLKIACSPEEKKGLCPLGEIAIKLDPALLSPCKSMGSLFCFMPVPIKSSFNFLINGYFDISRDRRSLKKDEHGNLTEWNTALIQDTIGKCFLQMLKHLDLTKTMEADSNKCLEAYYSIWPHKVDKKGSDHNQVIYSSIKKVLLKTDAKLLYSHDKWVCHKDAYIYLNSPKLPDDRKSETVLLLLKHGYPMVDIPSHVKDILSPKTVSYEEFCTNVLFTNLKNIGNDVRNNQVIQLIKHFPTTEGWEFKLLTAYECVPTKPNGTLKKPKDLVDPKSHIAKLYSEEDERFPEDKFCEPNIISTLKRCGMVYYKLNVEQLKERACTITNLPIDQACSRSQEIVKYIVVNDDPSTSSEIAKELSEIKFLPVMKCPNEITLPWFGTGTQFESPSRIYPKICQNVLFTQEPIYDPVEYIQILVILEQKEFPPMDAVLRHFKCLIHYWQNNKVNNEATSKLIGESCREVYEHLQRSDAIAKYNQYKEEFQQLKNEIGGLPFVWHSNQFLSVDSVVLKWNYVTYDGFLCELSKDTENRRYEQLFRTLGINESPTIAQCMSILQRLYNEMTDAPLLPDAVEFCCGIAKYLVTYPSIKKESTDDNLLQQLYLPDESCIMRHISNLAYRESVEHSSLDNSRILESHFKENAYWLHPNFSGNIAKCLGIPSALESILSTIIDDSFLHGSEYGQQEDLCDRINSLLGKYPSDAAIFKEFIQNAEDAGASELAFILDQREFPAEDGELFSDSKNWHKLHTSPSLLIYNNKTMTEDDLIGITKLGRGNKRDSLESIGRFGVGFNVAYHITDCPMFVSYGPGGVPENLCVLDPTCQYAPRATERTPGQRWKLSHEKYVEQFSKQLKPFLDSKVFGEFQKFSNSCILDMLELNEGCVVFRLPLTKSSSNFPKSELLPSSYMPVSKVQTLLETLAKEAHKLPLFIKNLKCISAFEISKDGKCSHYFTTTITMDPESATSKINFSENVTCKLNKMTDSGFEDVEIHTVLYRKHIKTTIAPQYREIQPVVSNTSKKDKGDILEDWLISEQFGGEDMPSEVLQAGISAGLIPLGGVAIKVSSPKLVGDNFSIFCSLPLPVKSYLPFHVNGHFWVDDSRKHFETGTVDSPLSKWNESLATTVIPSAYLAAIERCRQYINFRSSSDILWYYLLFPNDCINKDSKLHSFQFIKFIYTHITRTECNIIQIKQKSEHANKRSLEWMTVHKACFLSDKYRADEKLPDLIVTFNIKLTNAPIQIYNSIKTYNLECPDLITPNYMINFLKSVEDIKKFENLIKSNIQLLLNYCLLASKEYDDMLRISKGSNDEEADNREIEDKALKKTKALTNLFTGVPLLITVDGQLRRFDSEAPVYHNSYAQFFSHKSEDFVDQRLEECEIGILKECGFVKDPDIKYLAENTLVPNSDFPLSLHDVEDIYNFWKCLDHIILEMKMTTIEQIQNAFQCKPVILGSDDMLYPLSKGKMVLHKMNHIPACKIMTELGYPTLNTEHQDTSLLVNFVASPEKGDDTVLCIHLHQKNFEDFNTACFVELEQDLHQFIHTLSSSSSIKECITSVCKLPIFKTFDKKFEAIGEHSILLPKDHEKIPFSGFDRIINQQILIPEGAYSQIYEHLCLISPSLSDFYTDFIFPQFAHMDEDDIFKHLDFLRIEHCITDGSPLSMSLKSVPFMKGKTVSEYYDPHVEVFTTFLSPNLFPYPPWVGKKTWLPVLRILDLKTNVSGEKLVEFANIVSLSQVSGETIDKAKILLHAIGERLCDKQQTEPLHCCKELSSIEFVPTYIDGDLKRLLQKFTKEIIDEYFEMKFIPFQEAIIPHHQGVNYYQISFASNAVIDWSLDNLRCNKSDQDEFAQMLHMNVRPSCSTVVDNLLILSKLVTSISVQSARNFFQRVECVSDLQNLFVAHYHFLEDYSDSDATDLLRLQNERFVFVRKEESNKTFSVVHCTKIVKFMAIQKDLSPYLFKMPNYFSRYIGLIRLFNIQETPTSLHFAKILKELYLQFHQSRSLLRDSHLCLTQAEIAFANLLEILREEDVEFNQGVYYLLDENNSLHPQSELVYNDAPWYRSRLEGESYHFMKQPMQGNKGNFFLPKCLQIPPLTSLVMEEISNCTFLEDNECMNERLARQSPGQSNGCIYVASLKLIVKSKHFKDGLRRIIHHQTGNAPSQKDEASIGKLDNLEFKCYHSIVTVLKDIGTAHVIHTSTENVFCAIHDGTKMCIAPHIRDDATSSDNHPTNLDEVVNAISLKLNNYLNNIVSNDLHIVQMIKSDKPNNIQKRLDQLHIKQYNEGTQSFKVVGDMLKEAPESSDQVVFESYDIKEQVIYWNSEGDGILVTIQSIQEGSDNHNINLGSLITLVVNDNKDTEVTTLFCISKLLHPSQIQCLNLDGQETEQNITGDLLLYDIPHESEDKAIAWIASIVKYCRDDLLPKQCHVVLKRLRFYAYYYLITCNQARDIYDAIINILDAAVYDTESLLQSLEDSLLDDDLDNSQNITASPIINAFSLPRSSFIRPPGITHGYHQGPSNGYHFNPAAGRAQSNAWGVQTSVEERPQVNLNEAQIWYHQASANYKACESLIESSIISNIPGDFKCQHCALVCFLSHEIVDLCLKALCHAFVGLSGDLKNATNILIFYKQLAKSSNCPSLDVEQYVHQVSEYNRSTRFPDAHVPSEPPCCVYDEVDAYSAFSAAQKVFKCVGEKLATDTLGTMTPHLAPFEKSNIVHD